MSRKFWVAAFVVVLLVDGLIALQYSFVVMSENCGTGDRWQCDETIRGGMIVALVAIPALYVALLLLAALKARNSGRQ
jgi:hypothetical protein